MSRFIDLSVPTQATPSEATPVTITVLDHHEAPQIFGLEPHDFPGGMAISNEQVALTSHTGTHMDAPLHYGPFSGGQPARAITDIPLSWCYGHGVRLDVRHRGPGEEIRREDIIQAETQLGRSVAPLDIVLVWTGADRLWGSAKYLTEYPGLGRDAVAYLVEKGVRVIGIDTWGMDRPMEAMLRDYRATGNSAYLWPAHLYGREQEYCQLEKLANLHLLPFSYGFQVVCFPVALANAGASWTRVVAIVE